MVSEVKNSKKTGKLKWPGGTMLFPLPVVMVSCRSREGRANIITVAWTGITCTQPPMLSISVTPQRFSHGILTDTGEFIVNVPSRRLAAAVDRCGVVSGIHEDKFALSGLTMGRAEYVKVPLIQECPLNLECQVRHILPLGSHDLFVAEIMGVQVSGEVVDGAGNLDVGKADLLAFAHGGYYGLGPLVGTFGFSLKKQESTVRSTRRKKS